MLKFLAPLLLLTACGPVLDRGADDGDYALVRSLTGQSFTAKKYYVGWGVNGNGNGMMDNEVAYDVYHTHDIFTKKVGGDYQGTKLIDNQANASGVRNAWKDLGGKIKPDDMYVQYSSGHGVPGGQTLGNGLSYSEFVTNAKTWQARETVILTMACYSGGMVETFKQNEAQFDAMKQANKVLYVMGSSPRSQESSTGPSSDGKAGSAFGHSVWKALTNGTTEDGKTADGFVDGVKDGMIDLSELQAFVTQKTNEVGGHLPQSWGFNYDHLIINEIPDGTYVASLEAEGGTAGMSDAQIAQAAAAFDEQLQAQPN